MSVRIKERSRTRFHSNFPEISVRTRRIQTNPKSRSQRKIPDPSSSSLLARNPIRILQQKLDSPLPLINNQAVGMREHARSHGFERVTRPLTRERPEGYELPFAVIPQAIHHRSRALRLGSRARFLSRMRGHARISRRR